MPGSVVRSTPSSSGLYDVLDLILDKGLVIDAYVRVSVVGIELLTIDLRVVIASVDTYLRFAEAVDRLNLQAQGGQGLGELMDGNGSEPAPRRERQAVGSGESSSVRSALDRIRDALDGEDQDSDTVLEKVRAAVSGSDDNGRQEQRREGDEG